MLISVEKLVFKGFNQKFWSEKAKSGSHKNNSYHEYANAKRKVFFSKKLCLVYTFFGRTIKTFK